MLCARAGHQHTTAADGQVTRTHASGAGPCMGRGGSMHGARREHASGEAGACIGRGGSMHRAQVTQAPRARVCAETKAHLLVVPLWCWGAGGGGRDPIGFLRRRLAHPRLGHFEGIFLRNLALGRPGGGGRGRGDLHSLPLRLLLPIDDTEICGSTDQPCIAPLGEWQKPSPMSERPSKGWWQRERARGVARDGGRGRGRGA